MRDTVLKYAQKIKDDKIFFAPNIPEKKLHNAIKSYGLESKPNEVLVLVDDTVFGGAKEGLMITEFGVMAKELGQPGRYVHLKVIKEITIVGKKILLNNGEFFKFNLPGKSSVAVVVEFIKDLMDEITKEDAQESELSEEEKVENKLLSYLPIPENNYFHVLWETLNKNKLSEKNKNAKQQLQVTLSFLAIALGFPDIINRKKTYNKKFIKLLDSEYITLEILIIVSKKATRMLTDAVNAETAQTIIETTMAKPLFYHYIMYKIELEKAKNGPSLKSVANPQEAIINHPVSRYLKLEQRDSETDFTEQLREKIFRIIVTQRDDYFLDGVNFKDHEYNVYEICKELYEKVFDFEHSIREYLDKLDHSIEKILLELFE